MSYKTLDDLDLAGKRVLIRADLNVPVEDGRVSDATRIERLLPTLRDVLAAGGHPILLSHFGRPKGRRVPEMSLGFLAPVIAGMSGHAVRFASDCIGEAASAAIAARQPGEIVLLENTRFHAGEEQNDPALARDLAGLGDAYVNDAFSAAHRAHASTEGIAHLLPACAGRAMAQELAALEKALAMPERPVVAVVGGAKVSTKLDLIGNLLEKVDSIVIGGGMANTFLAAQGYGVGKSLCEHDLAETACEILEKARAQGCTIVLPEDCVVAKEFRAGADTTLTTLEDVPEDGMILDAGPRSVDAIKAVFDGAKTLIWNGPLGAFEIEPFDRATVAAAEHAAKLTRRGSLISVAGGGDTVSALNHAGVAEDFTYISTAGGAFLEWMEGKTLPGVAALG